MERCESCQGADMTFEKAAAEPDSDEEGYWEVMEGSEIAKRDHQRNKSEIVKLVKEMFSQDKWGDEEYKKKLQELVIKDEKLVQDVIRKIKLEKGLEWNL